MVLDINTLNNIREKLSAHPYSSDILNRVDRIVECIDYEIDKYRDTRASVIFTGNLHPNTLFTMASHTKLTDVTRGVKNISSELDYIKSKYNINLEIEVCDIFYDRFSKVAIAFLDKIDTLPSKSLQELIINRKQFSDIKLIEKMNNLLDIHDSDDEISKISILILQVDPRYKVLRSELQKDAHNELHNINAAELSFDFIDYAVKLFHKIYEHAFGNSREISNDDEKSNKFK